MLNSHKIKSIIYTGNIIVLLSLITHVLNYIFTVLVGRMLNPAQFGEVATLWSILAILTVPAGAIGLMVVKAVATGANLQDIKRDSSTLLKYLISITLIAAIACSYFAINSLVVELWAYIAIVATAISAYYFTYYQNILLGKEDFLNFNLASIVSTFAKLVSGVVLVYIGAGVVGASSSLLIASLVGICFSIYIIKFKFINTTDQAAVNNIIDINYDSDQIANSFNFRNIISIMLANLLLVLLISLDVILANYHFGKDVGGIYASMSTISKIPLYVSMAIGGALYPVYARLHLTDTSRASLYFQLYTMFVVISTLVASILLYIWGSEFVQMVFGAKYLAAGQYLYMGVIYYGLINILYSYAQYITAKSKFTLTKSVIISIIYILITYVFFSKFN